MSNVDEIFWRRFGAILLALILFGVVVAFIARHIAGDAHRAAMNSPSAVAERLTPVGMVRVGDPAQVVAAAPTQTALAPAPAAGGETDGESVYKSACIACHQAGVAGAPKLGDQAAWAPRIALGQEALVASVVNGKGAMPAKGGNPALTEAQIEAAVSYMLAETSPEAAAGSSSAAPAVPAAVKEAAADAAQAAGKVAEKAADVVEKTAEKVTEAASAAVAAVTPAAAAGKPGDEVYSIGCVACHATGAANAPKLTDKAAWETRAAVGVDGLTASVINGKGAMPPKGGLATLSDADIGNAVRYMLKEAGVEAGG